jgi:predicted nucleotidyltransferase
MRVIRRYARAIADEFQPDKIILFGSYAYGTPHEGSDVDLLVIMPARNQHDRARLHSLAPGGRRVDQDRLVRGNR